MSNLGPGPIADYDLPTVIDDWRIQVCSKWSNFDCCIQQEGPRSPLQTDDNFTCGLCDFVTHDVIRFLAHQRTHSYDGYKCYDCDQVFVNSQQLRQHSYWNWHRYSLKCTQAMEEGKLLATTLQAIPVGRVTREGGTALAPRWLQGSSINIQTSSNVSTAMGNERQASSSSNDPSDEPTQEPSPEEPNNDVDVVQQTAPPDETASVSRPQTSNEGMIIDALYSMRARMLDEIDFIDHLIRSAREGN